MMRRWAIWVAVTLQVGLVSWGVYLDEASRPAFVETTGSLATSLLAALSILVFPAIGAVIFGRRPDHRIGWLLVGSQAGWAINNWAGAYVRSGTTQPSLPPGFDLAVWLYAWPGSLSVGALVLLMLLFPSGGPASRFWGAVAWTVVASSVAAALALAFAPGPVDATIGLEVANPYGAPGALGEVLAAAAELAFLWMIVLLAVSIGSVVIRQRRAEGLERLQLRWFTSAVVLVVVLVVAQGMVFLRYEAGSALPPWATVISYLGIVSSGVLPLAVGIAILRYRLYDIDRIINRTLVYGALTAILVLAYVGPVVLLGGLLRPVTGSNDLAVAGSTLAVAALFAPARRRIQAFVDRRFYRSRYDAARTVEAFSARLRDEMDLDTLTRDLKGVVRDTLQPTSVSVWLREPEREGR